MEYLFYCLETFPFQEFYLPCNHLKWRLFILLDSIYQIYPNTIFLCCWVLFCLFFFFRHHQSFLPESLHKLISLLHQRLDSRSKKKHSPTAAKTKTTLQKFKQAVKTESYVLD